MPIYAYRCDECGFAKDVLQKMSDEPLVDCPNCQKPQFKKQVTAAGFQLKGSGWYVTDFRGGSNAAPASASADAESGKASAASDGDAKPAATSESASAASKPSSETSGSAVAVKPASSGSENKAA